VASDLSRELRARERGVDADLPSELQVEQDYLTLLYARLDELKAAADRQLREVRLQPVQGVTHQGRSERDARASMLEDRVAQLDGVEHGLSFGRIDRTDDVRLYVGRIGMSSPDYDRLLVDWRAPAARPFYAATPGAPSGVVRRRHLQTRNRRVVAIEDDLLDPDALPEGEHVHLAGEGALLAALTARRTGHMRDIVATIQAEQDAIIRSDLAGVLVVEGGPGTGKTAVALHRAAYLLYEHRDRLASRGVLVVGPGRTFLRYIERVLPSLGETGVVLSTVAGLYSGARAEGVDADDVARVKGDARMAGVLGATVREQQRVPSEPVEIRYGRLMLEITGDAVARARDRARRGRRPHNRARTVFLREMLDGLARQVARELGRGVLDADGHADVVSELREDEKFLDAVDAMWPALGPAELLRALYGDRALRERAARSLGRAERDLLHRDPGAPFSEEDMPLLDELADLVGGVAASDPSVLARQAEEAADRVYAEETMAELELSMPVDAGVVAARYRGQPTRRSVADRAGGDRAWTYGHVVVDEAQELSPMAWRMLGRRCPSRSMTVVGDLAQASSAASARSWEEALDEYAQDRWRRASLTVNYRTPAEVMAVAGAVLRRADPAQQVPRSIREVGELPRSYRVKPDAVAAATASVVRSSAAAYEGSGTVGVVVPMDLRDVVAAVVAVAVPGAGPAGTVPLDAPAVVLGVAEVKGLEFDTVVVVEPAAIAAARTRGVHDLYVALTRATQRLVIVHSVELPDEFRARCEVRDLAEL
jgi:DNA helicase IV